MIRIWAHAATLALAVLVADAAQAASSPPNADSTAAAGAAVTRPDVGTHWRDLNRAQQKALAPLAGQWSSLDTTSKQKWINVANRYPGLGPAEQQRMQDRMTQWAKLPAQARGEARLRFQQTRQISPSERQEKWAAYQALSDQDRQELAKQAQRKQKPTLLSDSTAGPRESQQVFGNRRPSSQNASPRKSNVVPNTQTAAQVAVAPTLVKAGTGATTTLVTQRPTPPLHQHTGLPKIAATKGFVDPVTLLPKKGAQGAAMAALPPAASGLPSPGHR